ncbi:MAG: DUF3352 domain-containing protein [Algoriphagus sp.]|nr:DUF3352 domain-containing protein [Algoriphagus sp.]
MLVASLALGWYFIFGRSNALLAYVPDNAIAVAKVNVKSLLTKMDYEKIKQEDKVADQLDEVKNEMPDFLSEAMDSPLSTGIDPFKDPVAFLTLDKKSGQVQFSVLMSVQSQEDFGEFLKKFEAELDLDYKFRKDVERDFEKAYPEKISERNHAIAWNGDLVIFSFQNGGFEDDTMLDLVENTLFLNEERRLSNLEAYNEFESNLEDLDVFINLQAILNDNRDLDLPESFTSQINNLNGASLHLEFQEESIDLTIHNYFKDQDLAEKNNFFGEPNDSKITKYLTSNGKAIGAMALSLKMENLIDLIKKLDEENSMNEGLMSEFNLSIDQVGKMLSGSMAVSLTELKKVEVTEYQSSLQYNPFTGEFYEEQTPVTYEKTVPIFNYQLGISDANLGSKLLGKLEELNLILKEGNVYVIENSEFGKLNLVAKNDLWIISNDPMSVNLAGNGEWNAPQNEDLNKALTSEAMGMYLSLDINEYGTSEDVQELKNDADFEEIEELANLLKNVNGYGNNESIHLNIGLKPGEGNSLYRLSKALVDIAKF